MLLPIQHDNLIAERIAALPEVYQPIFGYQEYDGPVSRSCIDRLASIEHVTNLLADYLDRPLRILDLGCAQGFFSLSLGRMGARVVGVDSQQDNIALCQALQKKYDDLEVSFRLADAREVLDTLVQGEYDLILGLSIFHHMCYQDGGEATLARIASLATKVDAAIFEVACHTEPLEWGPCQPEDVYWLLQDFPFIHTISVHGTHLSDVKRPLIFCSACYWLLGNDLTKFDSWKAYPHEQAVYSHQDTRRYFFAGNRIAKMYRFIGEVAAHNREELLTEQRFLLTPPPNITNLPKIVACHLGDTEGWIIRESLSGDLLSENISQNRPYSAAVILRDILSQLSVLELTGLFHNDVRTWNVLVTNDGRAHLIDYGSITRHARDCAWPYDLFLSFIMFAHDVLKRELSPIFPLRSPHLSPGQLPPPYDRWANYLWRQPPAEWKFTHWLGEFDALVHDATISIPSSVNEKWMYAIEQYLEAISTPDRELDALRRELSDIQHHIIKRERQLQRLFGPIRPFFRLYHVSIGKLREYRKVLHAFFQR